MGFVFPFGSLHTASGLVFVVSCCLLKMPCSPQGMQKDFSISHWAFASMVGPILLMVLWHIKIGCAWNRATTRVKVCGAADSLTLDWW